jgi:hypothetical protein
MTQYRNNEAKKTRESNPPAFVAYHVTDRGRGRKFWTRVGAAWGHKEGEGLTVFLDVVPVNFDGRIVLRTPKAKEEPAGEEVETGDDTETGTEE